MDVTFDASTLDSPKVCVEFDLLANQLRKNLEALTREQHGAEGVSVARDW